MPAEDVERWTWDRVSAVLKDPSLIAKEHDQAHSRRRDAGVPTQLEGARRRLAKVEQGQARLMEKFRLSDDFPWELVEQEVKRGEVDRRRILAEISDLEARIAAREQATTRWASIEAYCQRVAARLDSFGFAERRLALEALSIRITANGRNPDDWDISGGVPLEDGTVGTLFTTSASCGRRWPPPPAPAARAPGL